MSSELSALHLAQKRSHPPLFVGRATELSRLARCFDAALRGERQLVFVNGQPGIGKTTLVDTFLQQLTPDAETWRMRGQCVEQYGAGEAYLPLLEALSRLGREPNGEKVIAVLKRYAPTWLAQLPALVSPAEQNSLQRNLVGATRERMLREIAEALEVLSLQRLLVIVLEDLHWGDQSTMELLAYLTRRRGLARLLIIATYRPVELLTSDHPLRGVVRELQGRDHCVELRLGLLSETEVSEYLRHRFPGMLVPPELLTAIHQRTGGNPLFMVTVMDQLERERVIETTAGQWRVRNEQASLEIQVPERLRLLIEKQLDELREEELRLLEIASVAGVEFGAAALAAILDQPIETVDAQCEKIAANEQFLRVNGLEEWPDGTLGGRYQFRHALHHLTVYERLSEARRAQLHRRIAECKEAAYGKRASEIAAELAMHFEAGHDMQQAIRYYGQAGRNAVRRQAHREAINQLSKGLALLQRLSETPERVERELFLQLALGNSLVVTKGYAAPEVEQAYARALELCQRAGETPHLIPALFGLCAFYLARAELQMGLSLTEQTLRLARQGNNQEILMAALATRGIPLYWRGDVMQACSHWEQALALYTPQQGRLQSGVQDFGVMNLCFQAVARWILGYPDQAREYNLKALTLAKQLSHPFSEGWALHWAARHSQCLQDNQAAGAHADALLVLATEHGFAHLTAYGALQRGWALALQGQTTEGIAQIQQSLQTLRTLGAEIGRPYFLVLLADAWRQAGDLENGLGALTEALAIAHATGECYYEAELHRLKGELILQLGTRGWGLETGDEGSARSDSQSSKLQDPDPRHQIPEERQQAKQTEGLRPKASGSTLVSPSSLQPPASSLSQSLPLSSQELSSPIVSPQAPAPNLFRQDGEYWTLTFEGTTCRVADTLGMHYLARLLQSPWQEFHVRTLAGEHTDSAEHLTATTPRGAEPSLDQLPPAITQRLHQLREELAEAEDFHDVGRKARLQDELEALTASLVRQTSTEKKAASATERLRLNVTRAIKTALRKITDAHPALGRHLTRSIKTGATCSYNPTNTPPSHWQI